MASRYFCSWEHEVPYQRNHSVFKCLLQLLKVLNCFKTISYLYNKQHLGSTRNYTRCKFTVINCKKDQFPQHLGCTCESILTLGDISLTGWSVSENSTEVWKRDSPFVAAERWEAWCGQWRRAAGCGLGQCDRLSLLPTHPDSPERPWY